MPTPSLKNFFKCRLSRWEVFKRKFKKILKIYILIASILIILTMLTLLPSQEDLNKIRALKAALYHNYKEELALIDRFLLDSLFMYSFLYIPFTKGDPFYPLFIVYVDGPLKFEFIKSHEIYDILAFPSLFNNISEDGKLSIFRLRPQMIPYIFTSFPIAINSKTKESYNIIELKEFNKMMRQENLSLKKENVLKYIERYLSTIGCYERTFEEIEKNGNIKKVVFIHEKETLCNLFTILQSKEKFLDSLKKAEKFAKFSHERERIKKIIKKVEKIEKRFSPKVKKINENFEVELYIWNPDMSGGGILSKWEFLVKTNGEILKCKETIIIDEFMPPLLL